MRFNSRVKFESIIDSSDHEAFLGGDALTANDLETISSSNTKWHENNQDADE